MVGTIRKRGSGRNNKQDSKQGSFGNWEEETAPPKSSSTLGDSSSKSKKYKRNWSISRLRKNAQDEEIPFGSIFDGLDDFHHVYHDGDVHVSSDHHNDNNLHNDDDDDDNDDEDHHNDDNDDDDHDHDHDNDDDTSKHSTHSTHAPSTKLVETFPDSENEFHEVIRNYNWDLLEILLKEYDYKKFIKPPGPKKPPRKLRVAKYLPEWRKSTDEVHIHSPLYGLDALGRAPLHLCCMSPCPGKPLLRLLFCARDVASVPDVTGSLPLHLAVTHEQSVEVLDKLIRGYHHGSLEPDASGRTPLMWGLEMMRRRKEQLDTTEKLPPHHTYWAHPATKDAAQWQAKQVEAWKMVQFLLENRLARRQKLLPREYRQIVQAMGLAAPPAVVSLLLDLGKDALRKDAIAGPVLSICVSRQYPLELLEKIIDESPMDLPKNHKDTTGRGLVAAHYRIGCMAHPNDDDKRESFRMIMQNLANAAGKLQEHFSPPKDYLEWWEKMKYLINLWGSYTLEDDASHNDFHMDDLLLHNALNNADVPPSLIRLLAALRPNATDLEHPKSSALPIHLACRLWRYKYHPPRRGEKELHMDKVVLQLLEGDLSRTRKRYRERLPIHHAVAAGKSWMFIKPLVVHDRKSLQVRDPPTKLYPFQMAACSIPTFDLEELARHQFTYTEWHKLTTHDQNVQLAKVAEHYDLEHLSLIYELLRHHPESINHESIQLQKTAINAERPKRKILTGGLIATEEVALTAQVKMIRAMFGLGYVSGHFIAWAYENTRRGWKTHRSNFGVLKEAIMDGLISTSMDKWWRKLKYWIWSECPWESPAIPHRDDFLLHGALCNPETSPWIIDLLLECFPRSASIPLPASDGCYPLHIACVTDRYAPLPFEFPNRRTVVEMTAKAYPDAALLKWKRRLPLHLAITHGKEWDEIRYLATEEPVALAIVDPKQGLFPFQLMALNRSYNEKQRRRFETLAQKEVGKHKWKELSPHEKVVHMSRVLEEHEMNTLGGVWELLIRNPVLVSVVIADCEASGSSFTSGSTEDFTMALKQAHMSSSGTDWMDKTHGLSLASIDFLDDLYEKDILQAEAKKNRESSRSSVSLDGSISDPFLESSFRIAPRVQNTELASSHVEQSQNSIDSRPTRTGASQVDQVVRDDNNNEMEEDIDDDDDDEQDERYEYIEYTLDDDESVSADLTQADNEFELSEEIPSIVDNEASVIAETDASPSQPLESKVPLHLGPSDHAQLCFPRRKDILFIRKASAFVIWKTETIQPGELINSSRRSYWAKVLKKMGEEVALVDLHSIRHEFEQTFLAAAVVDGVTIYIDEDDTYIWVLCGEDACSRVESYDVEAAIVATSPFLDKDTSFWLDAFASARWREKLSGKDDPHGILDWILSSIENAVPTFENKKFLITRKMLRSAFSHGTVNTTHIISELILEKAIRKLLFDIAKMKLESILPLPKKIICVRYFMARKAMFERQRLKFYECQKRNKVLKKLKRRQRHIAKASKKTTTNLQVSDWELRNEVFPSPTGKMSKIDHGASSGIGTQHLPRLEEPLLATQYHGTNVEYQDLQQDMPDITTLYKINKSKTTGTGTPLHLQNVHQPATIYEEDDSTSLAPAAVFDPPRPAPATKPLLAAALKAKQQQEQQQQFKHVANTHAKRATQTTPLHLQHVHQPVTIYEEDDSTSLAPAAVFDPPRPAPAAKPLLAAAIKAKEKLDQSVVKGLSREAPLGQMSSFGEGSMDFGEMYLSSSLRRSGSPRKDSSDARKAAPMTANLIRKNSMHRLGIMGENSTNLQRKPVALGAGKKKLPQQLTPARLESSSGAPHRQKPSIMSLLGKRQKNASVTGEAK